MRTFWVPLSKLDNTALICFRLQLSRRAVSQRCPPGRSTFSIEMKFIHAELGHRRFTSSGPLPFLPHSADPPPRPPPPLGQGRAPVYPRTSDAEERQRNLFAVNYVEGGFRSQRAGKWAAEYMTNLKDIFNVEWADVSWHKVSLPLRNWCPRCSFMWVMWISGHISVWHVPHICATMHFDKIFGWHYSVDPMLERSISTPVLVSTPRRSGDIISRQWRTSRCFFIIYIWSLAYVTYWTLNILQIRQPLFSSVVIGALGQVMLSFNATCLVFGVCSPY